MQSSTAGTKLEEDLQPTDILKWKILSLRQVTKTRHRVAFTWPDVLH